MAMISAAKAEGFPVDWEPLGSLWTIVASAGLVAIDLHRRKEISLLHNLGIPTSLAVFIGTLPAVVAEAILLMAGL